MIEVKSNIRFEDKSWRKFAKSAWEKKSIFFKKPTADIFTVDENIVFKWLVEYSDHCRKTKTTIGIKFFINGESQYQNEVLQALPVKSDLNLLGYHKRMNSIFSDYGLVCDELIQVSGTEWVTLTEFIGGLFKYTGFPNRQTEIGLYLGNYKKTPFGVHVDGCGVFSIPIVGEKTFRLWSPEYVRKHPDLELAFDYKKHLKSSETMTAKVGDMTYWPSSAWHIAESNGNFSATWSIGIWVDQPFEEILNKSLKTFVSEKIKLNSKLKYIKAEEKLNKLGLIKKLPKAFEQSADALTKIKSADLKDLFMMEWLRINSKKGFKSALKPNVNLKLVKTDHIQIQEKNPVLWARLKNKTICVACQGHLFQFADMKKNINLINRLNSGDCISITEYVKSKEILGFLNHLYQVQQIKVINGFKSK